MKNIVITTLVILFLLVVIAWGYLRYFEYTHLFVPSKTIHETPADHRLRFQEVNFASQDGTSLHGWWIPAAQPRATIIYCQGNAGNIGSSVSRAPDFHRMRCNLFLWDYRGYGRSGGRPSERGLYEDARAAYNAAAAISKNLPIIAYGVSLGGAVAVQLATDAPVDALIVEASFASAPDIARRWYPKIPLHRLLSSDFNSAEKAAALPDLPKLFGHSIHDPVIPFQSGRLLFAAAAEPKKFILLEGDHNTGSWLTPNAPGNPDLEAFLSQIQPKNQ